MRKYTVNGAQIAPRLRVNLDIARHSKKLSVTLDLKDGFIIEYTKDEITGKETWEHVINGTTYVKDKAPKRFSEALKPYITGYNVYRSDAVRSGKILALFEDKPTNVIDSLNPEEVIS